MAADRETRADIAVPAGFSAARLFAGAELEDVPEEPGVHVVWDPDGRPLYVGYTRSQRRRLRQHLSGAGSVFHDKVREELDARLGRAAEKAEILDYLNRCSFSHKKDDHPKKLKGRLIHELSPQLNELVPSDGDAPNSKGTARVSPKLATGDVRTLVEGMVPDPEARRRLLLILLDCIRTAHEISPSSWEITVMQGARNLVRLNVGQIVSFSIEDADVDFTFSGGAAAIMDLHALARDAGGVSEDEFKSAEGVRYMRLPSDVFLENHGVIEGMHLAAVRQLAQTVVSRTGYWRHHQPALVAYLAEELGEAVPEPDYGVATSGESPWDEFIEWARRFHEDSAFDSIEREYKVAVHEQLKEVRLAVINDESDWIDQLKKTFGSSGLTTWRDNGKFISWCTEEPAAARSALLALWEANDVLAGMAAFFELFPKAVTSGVAGRVTRATYLAMALNVEDYPIYRWEAYREAMKVTGYPLPDSGTVEISLHEHVLEFLDRISDEAAARGLELRDRLDAQCVMWAVMRNDLPEPATDKERDALRRYRGIGTSVWWVNQGATYAEEQSGGYVWAPQRNKAGNPVSHHLAVSRLHADDVVIHYAKGKVQALGRVLANAKEASKPSELDGQAWEREGYKARVEYFELDEPIALAEIETTLRSGEGGAFNRNGGVNQGYMYPLSADFVTAVRDEFAHRWPVGSPWESGSQAFWLFQGNPKVWSLSEHLETATEGQPDDWTVTRYRDEIRIGDRAALWEAGPDAGVLAFAEVTGGPFQRPAGEKYARNDEDVEWAIPLRLSQILDEPIPKSALLDHPVLGELSVIRSPQGTNFRLTPSQWAALRSWGETVPTERPPRDVKFDDIRTHLKQKGLRISSRTLRRFHNSMESRGFVILSGISGTGKTWLTELYSEAIGAEFLLVPVAPNWTSNEDLIGFFNPIQQAYQHTGFSRFLKRAAEEYETAEREGRAWRKYVLLLDEMNLARVEQYFAKFLSKMEVRSRQKVAEIELSADEKVRLTPNLYFVGTVNIDETTHGFADKVYDRAQLIELQVDREALSDYLGAAQWRETVMNVWDAVAEASPFAYRVLNDMRDYIDDAQKHGASWQEALDEQVLQKVLPKLTGSDLRIQTALEQLLELLSEDYPLSHQKVDRMLGDFRQHGFTSYF